MRNDDAQTALHLWVTQAMLTEATGGTIAAPGRIGRAFIKLLAEPETRYLQASDLQRDPVIAKAWANLKAVYGPLEPHWVTWWGPVGSGAEQVFEHDREVQARERAVSLLSKRRDRDSATPGEWEETDQKVKALTFGPARRVTWTMPDTGEEWEFQIAPCDCPDPAPRVCLVFEQAARGTYVGEQ